MVKGEMKLQKLSITASHQVGLSTAFYLDHHLASSSLRKVVLQILEPFFDQNYSWQTRDSVLGVRSQAARMGKVATRDVLTRQSSRAFWRI